MNTLCVTGWQQNANALACIAPQDAQHIEYSTCADFKAFASLLPATADIAIGWSLGGQLLVRAIAEGHVKAGQLVLLGAPFQFVTSDAYPQGMPQGVWNDVVNNYTNDPVAMLRGFGGIISAGDTHATRIARILSQQTEPWKNGLYWLQELGRFSCADIDFDHFPPTIIIHGENDRVVYPIQAGLFAARLPRNNLHLIKGCSHAPHLHDADALRKLIHV